MKCLELVCLISMVSLSMSNVIPSSKLSPVTSPPEKEIIDKDEKGSEAIDVKNSEGQDKELDRTKKSVPTTFCVEIRPPEAPAQVREEPPQQPIFVPVYTPAAPPPPDPQPVVLNDIHYHQLPPSQPAAPHCVYVVPQTPLVYVNENCDQCEQQKQQQQQDTPSYVLHSHKQYEIQQQPPQQQLAVDPRPPSSIFGAQSLTPNNQLPSISQNPQSFPNSGIFANFLFPPKVPNSQHQSSSNSGGNKNPSASSLANPSGNFLHGQKFGNPQLIPSIHPPNSPVDTSSEEETEDSESDVDDASEHDDNQRSNTRRKTKHQASRPPCGSTGCANGACGCSCSSSEVPQKFHFYQTQDQSQQFQHQHQPQHPYQLQPQYQFQPQHQYQLQPQHQYQLQPQQQYQLQPQQQYQLQPQQQYQFQPQQQYQLQPQHPDQLQPQPQEHQQLQPQKISSNKKKQRPHRKFTGGQKESSNGPNFGSSSIQKSSNVMQSFPREEEETGSKAPGVVVIHAPSGGPSLTVNTGNDEMHSRFLREDTSSVDESKDESTDSEEDTSSN